MVPPERSYWGNPHCIYLGINVCNFCARKQECVRRAKDFRMHFLWMRLGDLDRKKSTMPDDTDFPDLINDELSGPMSFITQK